MSDPAVVAQRQQLRQQSLIADLVTLPFRLLGVLCGSLLLCITVECIGLHFLWPEQGWHHAQAMLQFELNLLSRQFMHSVLMQEPGRTAHHLIEWIYESVFIKTGLLQWISEASVHATTHPAKSGFRQYVGLLYGYLANYLIAAAYTVLVFLVRLLVLWLTLPLLLLAAFVGLVDGLVRRDIRRFGAGRESGFVYHRAKASLMPVAVLPWVIYLTLPIGINPLWILLPSAALLGMAVDLTMGSFKKYL